MLADQIKHIYPDIDFRSDCTLQDDGAGPYIKAWSYSQPQPTPAEIDAAALPVAKKLKLAELDAACEQYAKSGFPSSALGAPHMYASAPEDRTNVLGAFVAGVDMPFFCTDQSGVRAQKPHTAAQMAQVYVDGVTFLQNAYGMLDAKVSQVHAAQTVEAVDGISW